MKKIYISWEDFGIGVDKLIKKIKVSKIKFESVYGIPYGGLPLAIAVGKKLNLPFVPYPIKNTLIIDDISDTGRTLSKFKNYKIACLYSTPWTKVKPNWYVFKKTNKKSWIIFPYENQETESKEK